MHWNYLVIILCLLLAVFAVIKEYRRGDKQRLGLRIVAVLLAAAALACIAIPVFYLGEADHTNNEAVLLTDGFSRDSLNKFKTDTIYTTDIAVNKEYSKAKLITPDQLKRAVPSIAGLHILGYGLTTDELKQLDSIPVVFHPGQVPTGVMSVSWLQKLKQGQPFVVQGKFNNNEHGQVRLILKELNTGIDSTTIEQQGNESFELRGLPKSTGRMVDQLLVLSGHDTLAKENLPVLVEPIHPLKILMLSAAPDFENKFLKNWLTQHGFEVAVRSEISKDKVSTQFTSIDQMPLTRLSAAILDKFDLVIADLSELRSLSASEGALLKQQVSQNGLGIILRADSIFKTPTLLQGDFSFYKAGPKEQKNSVIQIQDQKKVTKIASTPQLFISYKDGMQSLVSDAKSHLLAGVNLARSGKVVCTTLDNTYTWMLAGNKDDYTAFWSLLIGKAAKTETAPEKWAVVTPLPVNNSAVTIQLETAQQPGQILMDNESAPPKQNEQLPFQWQSTWWPAQAGWHSINHTAGSPGWIYIDNKAGWSAIKAADKISETKKYAADHALNGVTKQIHIKVKIPVSKVYFYILLLLCCTFLWIEGKMPGKAA